MFAVGNSLWKIKTVSRKNEKLQRSNGTYTIGASDLETKTIYICEGLSLPIREKVLTHEIVHAYALEYDLQFDIRTEEILADFVATYGRRIFRTVDNVMENDYVRFERFA